MAGAGTPNSASISGNKTRSAPAAGTVVAAGADYTLTENDLSNLISLNEGVRFALVNGQIVTAE